jgi:hypothetical protein
MNNISILLLQLLCVHKVMKHTWIQNIMAHQQRNTVWGNKGGGRRKKLTKILWRNRPMREMITFGNLEKCNCTTVAERCRVLPPFPSPRFASLCVLLGYAISIGSRNNKERPRNLSNITHNSTRRCFLRMSDSSIDSRDRWQCSSSKVRVVK